MMPGPIAEYSRLAPPADRCSSRVYFDPGPNRTASHIIVPPSFKRRGLVFFGPNSGRVTLANDTPVVIDQGLTLTMQSGMVYFCLYSHGDCVRKPWYCIADAVGSILSWVEVMEP